MVAYVVAQVNVTDPERYKKYAEGATAACAKYGGKFLTRGGKVVPLEGAAPRQRNVLIEFKDVETATAYYNSAEYQAAKAHREGAADMMFFVIEGA